MHTIRLTPFEREELIHKVEVLIDTGEEMWQSCDCTEEELEALRTKINDGGPVKEFSDKEFKIIEDEAKDLLSAAESNLDHGFEEYKNDVVKLRKLVGKFEVE